MQKTGFRRILLLCAALLAGLIVGVACGGGSDSASTSEPGSNLSGEVSISGSSTVEPISVRVAELFEDVARKVSVTVDGPGTGDGFKLFCAGDTDISDASRAIKDSEAKECAANGIEYVELLVAIDGLAAITNASNSLTCVNLHDLYALVGPESAGFRSWEDAAAFAAKLGSTTVFGQQGKLEIYGPGEESGTFDSFVELALAGVAKERGTSATTRPDYNASADDNVIISAIQRNKGAFGWVGLAFAEHATGTRTLQVDGGKGCVSPTSASVAAGDYPLSRPLFIYVNLDKAKASPAIEAFVDFYMDKGLDAAVAEAGYVALTEQRRAATRQAWKDVK